MERSEPLNCRDYAAQIKLYGRAQQKHGMPAYGCFMEMGSGYRHLSKLADQSWIGILAPGAEYLDALKQPDAWISLVNFKVPASGF